MFDETFFTNTNIVFPQDKAFRVHSAQDYAVGDDATSLSALFLIMHLVRI